MALLAANEGVPMIGLNNNERHDHEAPLVERPSSINKTKIGLLILVTLTILGGATIAVVTLAPFGNDSSSNDVSPMATPSGNNNIFQPDSSPMATLNGNHNIFQGEVAAQESMRKLKKISQSTSQRALQFTDTPTYEPTQGPTFKPTNEPTTSAAPTASPSSYPTAAPTVPQMGCRRDRFDNEGNREKNNRVFAGSYVCSDDDAQRYRFGIDPETGNLIWRDSLTGQLKTYYWNEWHRNYLEQENQKQRQLESSSIFEFQVPKNGPDSTNYTQNLEIYQMSKNYSASHPEECVEWVRVSSTKDDLISFSMVHYNCTDEDLANQLEVLGIDDEVNADFDGGASVARPLEVAITAEDETEAPSFAPTRMPTSEPNNAPSPTQEEEETFLDYYFSLSTTASFKIWRVQRTADYEIKDQVLHWELPSVYTVDTVYVDCLFKHDCPYMHLHQDGVMVLAWLDFENSQWSDGWMEKNIRSCYNFNTTDAL